VNPCTTLTCVIFEHFRGKVVATKCHTNVHLLYLNTTVLYQQQHHCQCHCHHSSSSSSSSSLSLSYILKVCVYVSLCVCYYFTIREVMTCWHFSADLFMEVIFAKLQNVS